MIVRYFASLREHLGCDSEDISTQATSVDQLITELSQRGVIWQELLADNPRLQIAVNQKIARRHTLINDHDEIAFFPPVTGG